MVSKDREFIKNELPKSAPTTLVPVIANEILAPVLFVNQFGITSFS